MRKPMTVLLLAACLSAGASAAYGAGGWTAEGNDWYYYENNGTLLTDSWKRSGNDWYWLGSDGRMAVSTLIEDGDHLYYVDETGRMVRSRWVEVAGDDNDLELGAETRWYYFTGGGKAVKDKTKYQIGSRRYGFDPDGKMLFGFVRDGEILTEDESILSADRYYGEPDDGALYTGWLKYTDYFLPDFYYEKDITDVWFYFNPEGVKLTSSNTPGEKKINGQKYRFDEHGIMYGGWSDAVAASGGKTAKYYSGYDDGHMQKKGWFKAIPSHELSPGDHDDGAVQTFYAKGNGYTIINEITKIDGAYYAFDEIGRRCTGLLGVRSTDGRLNGSVLRTTEKLTDWSSRGVMGLNPETSNSYVAYFTETGALVNKSKELSLTDGKFLFRFSRNGTGLNGVHDRKLYVNGILQRTASSEPVEDDRVYQLKKNLHGRKGEYAAYIVDRSGKLVTKSLSRRDASTGYTVAVHFFDNDSFNAVWLDEEEDVKKAASYFAKHGDLGAYAAGQSVHYQCSVRKITGSCAESLVDQNSYSSFAP